MSDVTEVGGGDDSAFCGACGAQIEASARFCTSCGESQERFVEAVLAEAGTAILPTEDFAPDAALAPDEGLPPPSGAPLPELPPPGPAAAIPSLPPPLPTAPAAMAAAPKQDQVTGMVVLGYVCAVVLPLAGAVIGGALHRRNRHGIRIVVLSLALMALFAAAAVAMLVALGVEVAHSPTY